MAHGQSQGFMPQGGEIRGLLSGLLGPQGSQAGYGSPAGYGGLLTPRDRQMAIAQMLLAGGGGLLAAGAPSRDPGHGQRMMGHALGNAGQVYQDAMSQAADRRIREMKYKQLVTEEKRRARMQEAVGGLLTPGPSRADKTRALAAGGGPTQQAAGLLADMPQTIPLADIGIPQGMGGLLGAMDPDASAELILEQATRQLKAPTIREFKTPDGKIATRQFDRSTGQWTDLETAPRWSPDEGGGLTTAQQRTNAEITQARASLKRRGLDHAQVIEIARSQKDTGRDNPDHDPFINQAVRLATQRKYGDDPDYARAYERYLTPAPPPPSAPPHKPAVSPAPASAPSSASSLPHRRGSLSAPTSGPGTGVGRRGPSTRGIPSVSAIATMSVEEIDDLVNAYGARMSKAHLAAAKKRLGMLGFGSGR